MAETTSLEPWDREKCLKLIRYYQNHPFLWDPKNEQYYNKSKKTDSWLAISREMNEDVDTVQIKMTSFLAWFRRVKSRVKNPLAVITETGIKIIINFNGFNHFGVNAVFIIFRQK